MDNTIIKGGRLKGVASSPLNLPIGIEYEELQRKLKEYTNKKYNLPIDKRMVPKNVVLCPRSDNLQYETNMFSVYPQDNIPYQESGSWIGGYNE